MADDGRRAALPGHTALAQVAARGGARLAGARPDREPRRRDRPCSRRAGRVRAARHVRRAIRRDRSHRGALPGRGKAAREPRTPPGAGSVLDTRCANLTRQREIVDAFLAASRGGDFDALLAVLDPDIVLRADRAAVQMGASKEVRGAAAVAETFSGRARAAQPALVNGAAGLVWASRGRPHVVFGFTITRGKIVEIDMVADPERLRQLDIKVSTDSNV